MNDFELKFQSFPKIARLSREMIVTEKIDGTNAQILIGPNGEFAVGSRNQWITPDNDNHGFAAWAYDHKDELLQLGPGRHFGEWWGSGINRGYGLKNGEKRLSLFNVIRWAWHGTEPRRIETADPRIEKYQDILPPCVGLVPVLYQGEFKTEEIELSLNLLRLGGSIAAPGFMNPEGVVAYHVAGNVGFKKTLKNDDKPKGNGT